MMKRAFDIVFSFIGLLCLSPLFALIAILVAVSSPGGVFFRGERIGIHGKPFKIYKFRSMKPDCEGKGKWNVSLDDSRVTPIGRLLRRTKLDELPQLINVLCGDMSFVGYRPELAYYVNMYTDLEKPILDLKPGITDWASIVNYNQFVIFGQSDDPDKTYIQYIRPLKLKLQLYYRYSHSFFGDFRILLWTVYKVFSHNDKLPKEISEIVDEFHSQQNIEPAVVVAAN